MTENFLGFYVNFKRVINQHSGLVRKHTPWKAETFMNSSAKSCNRAWQGGYRSRAWSYHFIKRHDSHTEARPHSLRWAGAPTVGLRTTDSMLLAYDRHESRVVFGIDAPLGKGCYHEVAPRSIVYWHYTVSNTRTHELQRERMVAFHHACSRSWHVLT